MLMHLLIHTYIHTHTHWFVYSSWLPFVFLKQSFILTHVFCMYDLINSNISSPLFIIDNFMLFCMWIIIWQSSYFKVLLYYGIIVLILLAYIINLISLFVITGPDQAHYDLGNAVPHSEVRIWISEAMSQFVFHNSTWNIILWCFAPAIAIKYIDSVVWKCSVFPDYLWFMREHIKE